MQRQRIQRAPSSCFRTKIVGQVEGKISNLVVLDYTWFQTDQIIESLEAKGYNNFIKLEGYESVFWRYNHYGEEALSSAESVMHFLREFQARQKGRVGAYDSLMLLYALNIQIVGKFIFINTFDILITNIHK